ncbi:unnamed protein product, partial [Prorocentrum cordatum]
VRLPPGLHPTPDPGPALAAPALAGGAFGEASPPPSPPPEGPWPARAARGTAPVCAGARRGRPPPSARIAAHGSAPWRAVLYTL